MSASFFVVRYTVSSDISLKKSLVLYGIMLTSFSCVCNFDDSLVFDNAFYFIHDSLISGRTIFSVELFWLLIYSLA